MGKDMALDEPEGEVMQDGNVFSHYTSEMKQLIGKLDDMNYTSPSGKTEKEVSGHEPTGSDDHDSDVKRSSSFNEKLARETAEVRKERVKMRLLDES